MYSSVSVLFTEGNYQILRQHYQHIVSNYLYWKIWYCVYFQTLPSHGEPTNYSLNIPVKKFVNYGDKQNVLISLLSFWRELIRLSINYNIQSIYQSIILMASKLIGLKNGFNNPIEDSFFHIIFVHLLWEILIKSKAAGLLRNFREVNFSRHS